MGEMLKELGKFFYNLALLIAGGLILQPLAKGNLSEYLLVIGTISIIGFVITGSILIVIGEKLKNRRD
jgi:hypothetical protein